MATTSLWRIKGPIGKVLSYASNPEKTERADEGLPSPSELDSLDTVISYAERDGATDKQKFVYGINCNPETAREEMNAVKRQFGKMDGTIAYHGYQSFKEGEVTAELAHKIGIELANELWGDRYQVLVATHIDKESHYHNHFVINTVSFVDGKKFHRTNDDYRLMQEVSDRICKSYSLSVIDNKGGKSTHYAQWLAENEGRPTVRGSIRVDIDDAISKSITWRQFQDIMISKGYEFKLFREDGELLKYPGIKPPGSKGYFRFHKLGKGYDMEEIGKRILDNTRPKIPFTNISSKPKRYMSKRPKKKLHGIYALYIRYCYELKIIAKKPQNRPIHMALREDLKRLSKYDEELRFMSKYGIRTIENISEHKEAVVTLRAYLKEEQRISLNTLKTLKRRGDEEGIIKLTAERKERTAKLRELHREEKLCTEIEKKAGEIREKIKLKEEDRSSSKEKIARSEEREYAR